MSGFGLVPVRREGYTFDLETGESHPTTDAERVAYLADKRTWLEIPVDPSKMSRAEVHKMVDQWLDDWWHRQRELGT